MGDTLTSRKGLNWTPERRRARSRARKRYKKATKKLYPEENLKYTSIDQYFQEWSKSDPDIVEEPRKTDGCKWCDMLKDGGLNVCLNCGHILNPRISSLKR